MMAIKSILPQGRGAWIFSGGIVALVLSGMIIFLGPIRNRFEVLGDSKISQEQKLSRNLAIVAPAAREAVEADYRRYGNMITMQGSSEEENSKMLSEVDQLAVQTKVVLSATKPRETRKDRDSEAYAVEIEIESDMSALMRFLCAVESSPQVLRVDRLVVDARGAKDPSQVRCSLQISKVVTRP